MRPSPIFLPAWRSVSPGLSACFLLLACVGALLACGAQAPEEPGGQLSAAADGSAQPSGKETFFVRLDWQTPTAERLATQCDSAQLSFFSDAEATLPRPLAGLDRLQVIMPCCASEPATKPRWQPTAGAAHRLDVVDICPSRSGRWELRFTARFDDGSTDDSVISFVAR